MTVARNDPTWPSLLGMGTVAALIVVVGMALGWVADSALNTIPIFIFVGLALGITGATRFIYVKFSGYSND